MTTNDIKKLAELLRRRNKESAAGLSENKRSAKKNRTDGAKEINHIFHNRRSAAIIRETRRMMEQLPGQQGNKALVIVLLALLYRDITSLEEIERLLISEELISRLYGGLCICFGGKNESLCIKVELKDSYFPNKYDYLNCFIGEFCFEESRELIYLARLLKRCDSAKFEELAYKDTTRLILLDCFSYCSDTGLSDDLIRRLMTEGDELQANIGFYNAVSDVKRDIRDYAQLKITPRLPETKSKRRINADMKAHLERLDSFLQCCSRRRRASLLTNYILSEREYPLQFGDWLMSAELQEELVYEITASEKIKHLGSLTVMAQLIHDFPCRAADGGRGRKESGYTAVLVVLKEFLQKKQGIYMWDDKQEILFRKICKVLPEKYLRRLGTVLNKTESQLMVSELDELVRFSIYHEDKKRLNICQGMRRVMAEKKASRGMPDKQKGSRTG